MKTIALLLVLSLPAAALAADPPPAARTDYNLDISTPMTVVIHHAWQQRQSRLVKFYEPGAIGLKANGDIALREGFKLTLPQRQTAEKLIDADNSDRQAWVASIADAHKRRDAAAVTEVRAMMNKRWHSQWKSGWYVQDEKGGWAKKP